MPADTERHVATDCVALLLKLLLLQFVVVSPVACLPYLHRLQHAAVAAAQTAVQQYSTIPQIIRANGFGLDFRFETGYENISDFSHAD